MLKIDLKLFFYYILFIIFIVLSVSIYYIKKQENNYIRNVTESALYFQNPSRTLLKVNYLFDEAIFDLHKHKFHKLKTIFKAKILLISARNLLKNKPEYKELIKIIDFVLLNINDSKKLKEKDLIYEFHKTLDRISFIEFKRSIHLFEKYKKNIQDIQNILYGIMIVVLIVAILLLVALYQIILIKQIKNISETDQLTKAYNRRKFFNEMQQYKSRYSLIMFDIDHFKQINDTYGHDKGDYVLKKVVEIIKKHIRQDDMIFRWGGEEFFILFKNMDLANAQKMAEKLRKIIEETDFDGVKVTISLAVVTSSYGQVIEKIIKILDDGLYEAKRSGRNKVVVKGEK